MGVRLHSSNFIAALTSTHTHVYIQIQRERLRPEFASSDCLGNLDHCSGHGVESLPSNPFTFSRPGSLP